MIFSVRCEEKVGTFIRTARMLPKDPVVMWGLYQKLREVPNFLSGKNTARFDDAAILFAVNSSVLAVDDVGAILAVIEPQMGNEPDKVHVHMTFWDKRLRGREDLCREAALRLMHLYSVSWLYTVIPNSSLFVLGFAKRIGFQVFNADPQRTALVAEYDTLCRTF